MTTQPHSTVTKITSKVALASGAVVLTVTGTHDAQAGIVAAQNTPIRPPAQNGFNFWDVDGDGMSDFIFSHYKKTVTSTYYYNVYTSRVIAGFLGELSVNGQGGFGRLLRSQTYYSFPLRQLASGSEIGPSGIFHGRPLLAQFNKMSQSGVIYPFAAAWSPGETGFFGFAFNKNGQRHYGWGELQFDPSSVNSIGYRFEVTRAYYNNTPGASINVGDIGGDTVVPEPSTLALAMLAAGGVVAYRSRRKQPAV
jgi:hypothetical protein